MMSNLVNLVEKRKRDSRPIEDELIEHPLWIWRAGLWVVSRSDPYPRGVLLITSLNVAVAAQVSPHAQDGQLMYFYKDAPPLSVGSAIAFQMEDMKLLPTPGTGGVLLDRISRSAVVEEVALRDDEVDGPQVTLFFTSGQNCKLQGKEMTSVLCAAMLEVLNCEQVMQ